MKLEDLDSPKTVDYRSRFIEIFRSKYQAFLLGFVLFLSISFFTISALKTHVQEFRNNQLSKEKPKKTHYIVKEGEDLWQIAEKMYGSGYNAYDIAKENNLKEPFVLVEGQELVIPSIAPRMPTQGNISPGAAATTKVQTTATEYTVQEGEYLWQIAEKMYGDGNMMNRIIEANSIPYPYNVEKDQKLIIPR